MHGGNAFWLDVIHCDMDGLMQITSNWLTKLNASASVWFSLHQVKIIRFSSLLKTMKKYISYAYSVVLPSHSQVLRMKQDRHSYTRKTDNKKVKSDKPCDVPSVCVAPAALHILLNVRKKLKFIFNKVCDHFSLILTL